MTLYSIKGIYLFSVFSLQGSPPFLTLDFGLCTRVSPAVFLSPRSNFPLGQRFPISNHVTSGFMSPRSFFPTGQRFLLPNHMTSGFMSPRSFFPTGQRFLLPNHVTSGCMSPRSFFTPWSVVSPPTSGHDVTDQSEARICDIWAPFTTFSKVHECLPDRVFSLRSARFLIFALGAQPFSDFSKVHEFVQNSLFSPRSAHFVIFALGTPLFSDFQQSAPVSTKQPFQPEGSTFCLFRTGRTTF